MKKTPISIALQGGGSHGAFTAGVLKKLSECNDFNIKAVSGTSSGAVNATLLSYGQALHGHTKDALIPLDNFWHDLGSKFKQLFSTCENLFSTPFVEQENQLALNYFLSLTKHFAPYQFNPNELNPLKELLCKHIDFDYLRSHGKQKIFIAATNISSHTLKIFHKNELTADHILASACLPSIHNPIEINNEYYWDGGFSGNPVIYPLIFDCDASDIIIVMIQPLQYNKIPKSVEDIRDKISELTFSSTFRREMRAIAFCKDYIKNDLFHIGKLDRKIANIRIHIIHAEDYIAQLNPKSRYNASPKFLEELQQSGYACADNWLSNNKSLIGKKETTNLVEMFS